MMGSMETQPAPYENVSAPAGPVGAFAGRGGAAAATKKAPVTSTGARRGSLREKEAENAQDLVNSPAAVATVAGVAAWAQRACSLTE